MGAICYTIPLNRWGRVSRYRTFPPRELWTVRSQQGKTVLNGLLRANGNAVCGVCETEQTDRQNGQRMIVRVSGREIHVKLGGTAGSTCPDILWDGECQDRFFNLWEGSSDDTIRLPREPEKCRITQDILCRKKRLECSTTWCHARERHKARRRRDK